MNVVSIGTEFAKRGAVDSSFRSTLSLLDFDIVLFNPASVIFEYWGYPNVNYQGRPSLDDDRSFQLRADIKRRKAEMKEILKLGRTIVVALTGPQVCHIATGDKRVSGTGRNAQTTRIVEPVDILNVLPIDPIKTVEAQGELLDFRGTDELSTFWREYKPVASYSAYFQTPVGQPFLFVKGTEKVVGTSLPVEQGRILFVPYIPDKEDFTKATDRVKVQKQFVTSLVELVNDLNKQDGDFSLPDWTSRFTFDEEVVAVDHVNELERQLEELQEKLLEQKSHLLELQEDKLLFCGSGAALEAKVGEVFAFLGFEVAEGLPGRDDLILKYGDRVAVVEVKGVSKSAAEKHAAQLEKWVSEYISKNDVIPKGILVVNAFAETPLDERLLSPFPDQMLKFSKNRNHCLLTGTQLLNVYLECKKDPLKKDALAQQILNFDGYFDQYRDWSDYFTMHNAPELPHED